VKPGTFFCSALVFSFALSAASSDIPHLRKQGTATQLIVDGQPFLALAGELSNSSSSSVEYTKPIWPMLAASKLNTVLAAIYWSQIEPQEGKFDFSIPDGLIREARSQKLRLVFLWFGSWKNGLSGYPPDWLKKDFQRFPRAQIVGGTWPVFGFGQPRAPVTGSRSIELLSPLGDATRDADARAFAALMRHIKAVDGTQHTVIGIQVENEVGMQGDSRDRSSAANKSFDGPVPKELMDYLQQHKDTLIPVLSKVWEATGFKTSGTWEEVFGKGRPTDEIFMAWHFSRFVGRVVEAGKAEYPIPMFTNCPQSGFGRSPRGGQSGGPMPDAFDIWRAGAPRIDFFGPDTYGFDFLVSTGRYTQSGNPLFVPETASGLEGAARALYAFGRHDAIGFSPFGVDGSFWPERVPDSDFQIGYDILAQLTPLIVAHQGKGTMSAVLLEPKDPPKQIQLGNYTLTAAFLSSVVGRRWGSTEVPRQGGALFIATGPDEYIVAGFGVSVSFSPNTPGPPFAGLGTVEEGNFVNGRWVPGRSLAGDENAEGDCVVLLWPPKGAIPIPQLRPSAERIQRVTLYRYQ
jgi:hypothetical protein